MNTQPIKRLPANTVGRDFVMGDLHGEVHLLQQKLSEFAFDPMKDRLFSVGDLVDRGTDSLAALRLLREPWFHAVSGNHEAMMVDYVLRHRGGRRWHEEGGLWHKKVDREELRPLAKLAKELPRVLIVGDEPATQFKVVHAELSVPDEQLKQSWGDAAEAYALWSRNLHMQYANFCKMNQLDQPYTQVLMPDELHHRELSSPYIPIQSGFGLTFCGHTSVQRPGLWRSHFLLDTGAGWWPDAKLTVLEATQGIELFRHWRGVAAGKGGSHE